jgi:hypothetical protein
MKKADQELYQTLKRLWPDSKNFKLDSLNGPDRFN